MLSPKDVIIRDQVDQVACEELGITKEEFNLNTRSPKSSQARFLAYYILKNRYNYSIEKIGKLYHRSQLAISEGLMAVHIYSLFDLKKKT